jgi:hypothetical protein
MTFQQSLRHVQLLLVSAIAWSAPSGHGLATCLGHTLARCDGQGAISSGMHTGCESVYVHDVRKHRTFLTTSCACRRVTTTLAVFCISRLDTTRPVGCGEWITPRR